MVSDRLPPTSPVHRVHLAASRPVTQLRPDNRGTTAYTFGTTTLDDHAGAGQPFAHAIPGSCALAKDQPAQSKQ